MPMISQVQLYNETLGSTITFAENSFSHVFETCDLGMIEGVRNEQQLVGQDGILVANVLYGTRTITLVAWLIGQDDNVITAYRRGLNQFINPKQRLQLKHNGYVISGYPLHTAAYGTDIKVLNERMCRCMIEILCDDPLFSDLNDTTVGVALWSDEFVFPLEFALVGDTLIFGLRSASQIVEVTNSGDLATGMLITFTASGSVQGPKIINISTQQYLQVNMALTAGQRLAIDTRGNVPKVTHYADDGTPTNVINLVTDTSRFLRLPLGVSSFSYTADANEENLEVSVQYANRYLEVL